MNEGRTDGRPEEIDEGAWGADGSRRVPAGGDCSMRLGSEGDEIKLYGGES